MKTSMQELIEYLTEQLDKVVKEHPIEVSYDTYWRGVKIGLETTIALAESSLNKEKEQIVKAWMDGDNSDCLSAQDSSDFAEEYYNETFNTNEK